MTVDSLISVETVNIVSRLQCKQFDMGEISKIVGIRYNPGRFSAAFLRLSRGSCNIFRTGTVVLLGFKKTDDLDEAMLELACILGHQLQAVDWTPVIVNMVCSFNAGRTVKLPVANEKLKSFNTEINVEYEPELNNSMKIRSRNNSACALLHSSGKGIVTGLKCKSTAHDFVKTVFEIIESP